MINAGEAISIEYAVLDYKDLGDYLTRQEFVNGLYRAHNGAQEGLLDE